MPRAILEYNLPEDQDDFDAAIKGRNALHALWEMDQYLRQLIKYEGVKLPNAIAVLTDKTAKECIVEFAEEQIEGMRDKLREILDEHNISID
jgi:hypothetical protein